jgi:hypothetical protein
MYSVKPGRGPSAMGAIGGIGAGIFGVIWTIAAASMGAPTFFVLFGVVFIIIAIATTVYHFHNATQKNRMSTFDITTGSEETDPIAQALGHTQSPPQQDSTPHDSPRRFEGDFCPFCGTKISAEFDYCPKCGKDI